MLVGRLNVVPYAGFAQNVNDFAHREWIAAAPGKHDFVVALSFVERMPAQFLRDEFDPAHAAHRVAICVFGVANWTIFHKIFALVISSGAFHSERNRIAAAQAKRRNSSLQIAPLQLIKQRY